MPELRVLGSCRCRAARSRRRQRDGCCWRWRPGLPSRYSARPGISTAWCQAPLLTARRRGQRRAESRSCNMAVPLWSADVCQAVEVAAAADPQQRHGDIADAQEGGERPGRGTTEDIAKQHAGPGRGLEPHADCQSLRLAVRGRQHPAGIGAARCRSSPGPGVGHHAPSSGIHELVPLKPVAVTPATGPATPGVVFISVAGGFIVVRSLTGISLAAAVASRPDRSAGSSWSGRRSAPRSGRASRWSLYL